MPKPTNLDLRKSAKSFEKYLTQRIRDYPKYVNDGPGEDDDPITLITVGFQFDQAGWLAIVFDTRPNASPDGSWNHYIELNEVEFNDWHKAFDALAENGKPVQCTLPGGAKTTLTEDADEEAFAEIIGDVIRDVLLEAKQKGKLTSLPLADDCILCVEEHDGYYGWSDQKTSNTEDDSYDAWMSRFKRELSSKSREEQIEFLIGELDQYAKGNGPQADWAYLYTDVIRQKLEGIGAEAVVPVLKFVRRWAGKPEWDADRPKRKIGELPCQQPIFEAMCLVEDSGQSTAEVKKLLVQILKKSLKVNSSRRLWGRTPVLTSRCLHALFAGYPEPNEDLTNFTLKHPEAFLRSR